MAEMDFSFSRYVMPSLWLLGVVVFGLSIAGIANAQLMLSVDLFIAILVFTVLALVVSAVVFLVKRKEALRRVYDVAAAKCKRTADVEAAAASKPEAEVEAADGDEDVKAMKEKAAAAAAATTPGEKAEDNKWADNYVPYGDYPDGHHNAGKDAAKTKDEGDEKKDPVKE